MPHLTFPIPARDLSLTVVIAWPRTATLALVAAGRPIRAPLSLAAEIDTGTSTTGVDTRVLQQLGLTATRQGSSQTAGGQMPTNLFMISLSIPPPANQPGPTLFYPDLEVMELPNPLPGIDVLIGMDILLTCRFFLDGPGRQFTLDW